MGTIVGVDIGSNAVRAVEVSGYDTGKPVIVRQHEIALPETSVRRGEVLEVGTVTTALRRLWSTGGFTTKDVVLGLGGPRIFARDLSVPKATLAQIRESLPFQVQDMLPVPVGDALLDFYPIAEEMGEHGPAVRGMLVAAMKETVDANVGAVLGAGLRPVHVDLLAFALSRALAPKRTAKGRDVIVSIGASTTDVVVVDDGVPHFVRTIPNGGDDVTRALATRLQISPEQAEGAKRLIGMGGPMLRPEDRPALEVIYEVVGELLNAVRNTLSYFATANPEEMPRRILVSGGGAQLLGLPAALSELTGLPVVVAEPFENVPRARGAGLRHAQEPQFGYTAAYGLALGVHA
ncbi:type IV pilus assembly protein PilM [Pseudolysinimonas sp.]|jgi:type IV pilus assembly protein PilM|uniref:type IV pilus assembly protein PilM n=1 Tax=Pseudolysinimonas sp. TaxID=2680009 RepID=UPI003782FBE7